MTLLLPLTLAGAVLLSTGTSEASPVVDPDGFRPFAILAPEGGPRIFVYPAGNPDLVSLRISVPLEERAEEAGAGQLLARLAQDRMEALAARIGARASATRTGGVVAYEVSGTTADLDFLGWILREGLREPDRSRFEEVRRDALVALDRRTETPPGALASRIRDALSPGVPPPLGSRASLARMDGSRLSAVWARSHRRDALRVVVVGNLPAEVILTVLTDLGLPTTGPDPTLPPIEPTGEPLPRPEVIRHWVAEAWALEGDADPRALVGVRIVAEVLRNAPGDYEAGVELWEVGGRWALVVSGAAYPRTQQAMRNRVGGLLQEAAQAVTTESTARNAAAVRAEILETASTPWGRARVVGQALDFGGAPDGVEQLLAALAAMSPEDVRALFQELASRAPVREEIRP